VASLSAILLDKNYYELLKANLREVDGLPLLSETGIIPFRRAPTSTSLSARRRERTSTAATSRSIATTSSACCNSCPAKTP
jgi:hypothetical protein